MLLLDTINVWRCANGVYEFEWRTSRSDTRVRVELPDSSVSPLPHYFADGPIRAKLTGLPLNQCHNFHIFDHHGNALTVTERKLGMVGTPNFRDFGGYRTSTGQRVKMGSLFRSGQLCALSDGDVALLHSLNLDFICDFRRTQERLNDPNRMPEINPPRQINLPITPGSNASFFEQLDKGTRGRETMTQFMLDINADFVETQADTFAQMFGEILAVEDARFLVHCAAGKDRTGFAVAIILLALGVPRQTVMQDYLLTARFFDPVTQIDRVRKKYSLELEDAAVLPILEVHEPYLAHALDMIDRKYTSVESYLRDALGVGERERAELIARYVGA